MTATIDITHQKLAGMSKHLIRVRSYIEELGYQIAHEDSDRNMLIVRHEIHEVENIVLGCHHPLLIMEKFLFEITGESPELYEKLMRKNRDIIHGAFVIDHTGQKLIFRDTLQLENLDKNELEGSLNSLNLLLKEYWDELAPYMNNNN